MDESPSSMPSPPEIDLACPPTRAPCCTQNQALIPGLPDDLAMECLLQLPFFSQAIARVVCRKWRTILCSGDYICARRKRGFAQPWVLVFASERYSGKMQMKGWDVNSRSWYSMAAMPCRGHMDPSAFGCVASPDQVALFVCGVDCSMDAVLKFELFKNQWTRMRPMSTRRSFFGSEMIDGKIYVAGGTCGNSYAVRFAESYDLITDVWGPIASMGTNMAQCTSAVLNGKLYVIEGWSWPYLALPRGQIYNPINDLWENMTAGMREGWTGSSVVLNDNLYVISDHQLKAFDSGNDTWKNVEGVPMPCCMAIPFSVNAVNGDVLVVGRNLNISIATIFHYEDEGMRVNTVDWQSFPAPDTLQDFVPSHSLVLYI